MERVRGVILRVVKYGDNKCIVDLYTMQHGRMSFVAYRSSVLFPMSFVEFETHVRSSGSLPRMQAVTAYYIYGSVRFDPVKSSMLMFIAEFLSAVLREEGPCESLYGYLEYSMRWLDMSERVSPNFHIVFMLRLLRFLGITPNTDDFSSHSLFDMVAGTFVRVHPMHSFCLSAEESALLPLFLRLRFETMHLLRLTRDQRRRVIDLCLDYYRIHSPSFPELKSLPVLHEIFD